MQIGLPVMPVSGRVFAALFCAACHFKVTIGRRVVLRCAGPRQDLKGSERGGSIIDNSERGGFRRHASPNWRGEKHNSARLEVKDIGVLGCVGARLFAVLQAPLLRPFDHEHLDGHFSRNQTQAQRREHLVDPIPFSLL